MKNILGTSILVFIFCLSVFSQENANANCPAITVSGPAGITNPGDAMTFTVNLDEKAKNYNIEYVWTVSANYEISVSTGDGIIEGQGTSAIKVLQKNESGNITATVEIKGLPSGCQNTESETAAFAICLTEPVQIDEFSLGELRIDKARIDNFFIELLNNPNDQGFIVEKFKPGISKTTIREKLKKISTFIKLRGFDPARITIVQTSADKNLTQFWRVPAGADNPTF